jgi:DNA-directed RNA polymerase subunit RPC12/RpoP
MTAKSQVDDTEHEREGICPACGQTVKFTLLGEQIWPPNVAKRLGIPEKTLLYICANCQSTISESAILPR